MAKIMECNNLQLIDFNQCLDSKNLLLKAN